MATLTRTEWRRIATRGVAAGILGGILLAAFLYITLSRPQHQPIAAMWATISATATGHTVASPWFGLLIHFCVSIAWGIGYTYAASTRTAIAAHPYISGPVFGFIVMVIMQFVQLAAGVKLPPMTVLSFMGVLVAHCVFFGLPIAVYVSRTLHA